LQAGGFPEPELVHYNPKDYDFGKKKAFPFRDQVQSRSRDSSVPLPEIATSTAVVSVTDAE
jgi:hypothetical protein